MHHLLVLPAVLAAAHLSAGGGGGALEARYRLVVEAGGRRVEALFRAERRGRRLRYRLEGAEAPEHVRLLLAMLLERGGRSWLYHWPPPRGERATTVPMGPSRLRLVSSYCGDGWLRRAEAVGAGVRASIERVDGCPGDERGGGGGGAP